MSERKCPRTQRAATFVITLLQLLLATTGLCFSTSGVLASDSTVALAVSVTPREAQRNSPIPVPLGTDADTPEQLAALCLAKPTHLLTRWESHLCASAYTMSVQAGCMPQRRLAHRPQNQLVNNNNNININISNTNTSDTIKGVALFFHGFTACPDAMEFFAVSLQNLGYNVYMPLSPGHGAQKGNCTEPDAICVKNDRVERLPSVEEEYIEFVRWAVDMLKEEIDLFAPVTMRSVDFKVVTGGLSMGGSMATLATYFGDGLFNKVSSILDVIVRVLSY